MRSTYVVFAVVAAMSLYADETCKAQLEFLSDRIVHVVRKSPGAAEVKRYPVVTMKAKDATSPKVVVERDEKTGLLTFKRPNGEVLLSEKAAYGLEQIWALADDEAVFGLGIWQDLALDRRGKKRRMIQVNTEDFIPFWQSSKGYGVFWDNASPTTFEDTPEGLRLSSEMGEGIDYYFLLGDSADGVNRLMRELTGRVPLLPKWTYGYWISRERYTSWKEVHDKGAHLMITIWPDFGPKTPQFAEFKEKNMLMDFVTWPPKSGARSSSRTRRGAIAPRRSATATPTAESSSSRRTGRTVKSALASASPERCTSRLSDPIRSTPSYCGMRLCRCRGNRDHE